MLVCVADVNTLVDVNAALNDFDVATSVQQLVTTAAQAQTTLIAMNATFARIAAFQALAAATPVWPNGQSSSSNQYGLSSVAAVPT